MWAGRCRCHSSAGSCGVYTARWHGAVAVWTDWPGTSWASLPAVNTASAGAPPRAGSANCSLGHSPERTGFEPAAAAETCWTPGGNKGKQSWWMNSCLLKLTRYDNIYKIGLQILAKPGGTVSVRGYSPVDAFISFVYAYDWFLTGPAVTHADTVRRQNSSTTREDTREPTTASVAVTKINWSFTPSPVFGLWWMGDLWAVVSLPVLSLQLWNM